MPQRNPFEDLMLGAQFGQRLSEPFMRRREANQDRGFRQEQFDYSKEQDAYNREQDAYNREQEKGALQYERSSAERELNQEQLTEQLKMAQDQLTNIQQSLINFSQTPVIDPKTGQERMPSEQEVMEAMGQIFGPDWEQQKEALSNHIYQATGMPPIERPQATETVLPTRVTPEAPAPRGPVNNNDQYHADLSNMRYGEMSPAQMVDLGVHNVAKGAGEVAGRVAGNIKGLFTNPIGQTLGDIGTDLKYDSKAAAGGVGRLGQSLYEPAANYVKEADIPGELKFTGQAAYGAAKRGFNDIRSDLSKPGPAEKRRDYLLGIERKGMLGDDRKGMLKPTSMLKKYLLGKR